MKFNLGLENINYIKISCLDKGNNDLTLKAAVKTINEREIFACTKYEDSLFIETPQRVKLSIVSNSGLYLAETTLKFLQKEPPYIFFALETPTDVEHRQTREYFRVKMQKKAIISYKTENSLQQITCEIYDISANGIRLETDQKLENVDDLYINILFEEKSIKTKAKFSRIDNEDNVPKIAFQFTEISESDRDFISQKCIQQQIINKRNSAV